MNPKTDRKRAFVHCGLNTAQEPAWPWFFLSISWRGEPRNDKNFQAAVLMVDHATSGARIRPCETTLPTHLLKRKRCANTLGGDQRPWHACSLNAADRLPL